MGRSTHVQPCTLPGTCVDIYTNEYNRCCNISIAVTCQLASIVDPVHGTIKLRVVTNCLLTVEKTCDNGGCSLIKPLATGLFGN